MSSIAADIADALKTDLDGASWPLTLTSAREYLVKLERTAIGSSKRVSIFPYNHTTTREGRNNAIREHGIGLILRAQADPANADEVDALIETLEDIADRYAVTPIGFGGSRDAVPTGIEMILGDQLYDVDQLGGARIFQGGIVITYQTRT